MKNFDANDKFGFRKQLKGLDAAALMEHYNQEVCGSGFAGARGHYLEALKEALLATGLDCTDFMNEKGMSLKYPIGQTGRKIVQIRK